jgi:hypothetical protein
MVNPDATIITATLINRYPERFLFGADEVAPSTYSNIFKSMSNVRRHESCSKDKRVKMCAGVTMSGSLITHGRGPGNEKRHTCDKPSRENCDLSRMKG